MINEEREALIKLKELLLQEKTNVVTFSDYCKVYPYTNEDLNTIFMGVDGNGKKALTVLSSGDQVYDLVYKGFKDIDTFDINKFTKYYALGLKKCAIENLNYDEFCSYFGVNSVINLDIIKYLIDFMDDDNKVFWREYINNFNEDKNDLFVTIYNKEVFTCDINYLITSERYNQMKNNLTNANITFNNCNISDLLKYKKKYDLIYLSNIGDYLTYKECRKNICGLASHNLNKHGAVYVVGTCPLDIAFKHKSLMVPTSDLWYFRKVYKESIFNMDTVRARDRKIYKK